MKITFSVTDSRSLIIKNGKVTGVKEPFTPQNLRSLGTFEEVYCYASEMKARVTITVDSKDVTKVSTKLINMGARDINPENEEEA